MKKTAMLVVFLLLTAMLASACVPAAPAPTAAPPAATPAAQSASTPAPAAPSAPAAATAPPAQDAFEKPAKLTYWVPLNSSIVTSISTLDDNLTWAEMQKRFDVDIEFTHPPVGQEGEQYNLMLASREFPDLIEYNWSAYPGGPEKAIADGVIIKLNELYDKYSPAITTYIKENPELSKQFITDTGVYYVYPSLNKSPFNTTAGFFVRGDWLKELNLEVPETMDEIESVLHAFKEQKNADAPLSVRPGDLHNSDPFPGAYGVGAGYYVDGGKVKYGPVQPEYERYVQKMAQWYKDGLLDPDFVALDDKAQNENLLNERSGMAYAAIAGGMGTVLAAAEKEGKTISFAGMPYPVENNGDASAFSARAWEYRGSNSTAITTANKYIEFSAGMMDYFYSDDGHILKNFGVEGVTFAYGPDGPWWNDEIFKNPDGLTYRQAMAKYVRCDTPYPGFIDGAFHRSTFVYPEQVDTVMLWREHDDAVVAKKLPPLTPSTEEAEELAKLTVTINTFKSEMVIKYIMGQEKIENFSAFVSEIERMNIARALEIQQAAYDRYLKR